LPLSSSLRENSLFLFEINKCFKNMNNFNERHQNRLSFRTEIVLEMKPTKSDINTERTSPRTSPKGISRLERYCQSYKTGSYDNQRQTLSTGELKPEIKSTRFTMRPLERHEHTRPILDRSKTPNYGFRSRSRVLVDDDREDYSNKLRDLFNYQERLNTDLRDIKLRKNSRLPGMPFNNFQYLAPMYSEDPIYMLQYNQIIRFLEEKILNFNIKFIEDSMERNKKLMSQIVKMTQV
jgi:hypothetical protein